MSPFIVGMLAVSGLVDLVGFVFGLFYAGVFYDNLAHFLTSFSLVALAAELYAPRREKFLDSLFPATIYNPPLDSVVDTIFGMLGGALGAWTITQLRAPGDGAPHD